MYNINIQGFLSRNTVVDRQTLGLLFRVCAVYSISVRFCRLQGKHAGAVCCATVTKSVQSVDTSSDLVHSDSMEARQAVSTIAQHFLGSAHTPRQINSSHTSKQINSSHTQTDTNSSQTHQDKSTLYMHKNKWTVHKCVRAELSKNRSDPSLSGCSGPCCLILESRWMLRLAMHSKEVKRCFLDLFSWVGAE